MTHVRPTTDEFFLSMAALVATRATCRRRQVGCVLVNVKNHVIATGYNGPPRGFKHCITHPCPGANLPSGEGLEQCFATHGEMNAILQCGDVDQIATAYCTTAPCVHCIKLFLNTSCQRIVFSEDYPHSAASRHLWVDLGGRVWLQA